MLSFSTFFIYNSHNSLKTNCHFSFQEHCVFCTVNLVKSTIF